MQAPRTAAASSAGARAAEELVGGQPRQQRPQGRRARQLRRAVPQDPRVPHHQRPGGATLAARGGVDGAAAVALVPSNVVSSPSPSSSSSSSSNADVSAEPRPELVLSEVHQVRILCEDRRGLGIGTEPSTSAGPPSRPRPPPPRGTAAAAEAIETSREHESAPEREREDSGRGGSGKVRRRRSRRGGFRLPPPPPTNGLRDMQEGRAMRRGKISDDYGMIWI